MATQITVTLPALDFPKEVDYPTQEDWAAFSAAAEENFGILGGDWSTQMQLWKDQANAMSTELNNSADIAQAVANYQGDWVSQGYTLGQTVSVGGIYYICKLTHATGQNPTTGGSICWNLALGNWNLKVNNYGNETIAGIKTFSSNIVGNITGNAGTATTLSTNRSNYIVSTNSVVVGELMWKAGGNNHTIFDASASITPTGVSNNNTNPDIPWKPSLPTLMGYNGDFTYGVRVDSSRYAESASTANTLTTAVGSAPSYACRAWVNFNGTGTVAIRASGNVSSITDNGTGDYTVNFATAMPDANYSISGFTARDIDTIGGWSINTTPSRMPTTNGVRFLIGSPTQNYDTVYCAIQIFR